MSDRSKESREDALERILAETAKNPYVPRKPVRPAQRGNPAKSRNSSASAAKPSEHDVIPVTRILTEAQKAEAAKARAAKKVEDMRRARMQREEQEERKIADLLNSRASAKNDENTIVLKNIPEHIKEEVITENSAPEETVPEENIPESRIRLRPKNDVKHDDSGLWDLDSGKAEREKAKSDGEYNSTGSITLNDVLEVLESVFVVVLVIMLIFTYIIRINVVDGKSMYPTLSENDRLVVRTLFYTPKDGDVVIINNKSTHLLSEDGRVVEGEGLEKSIVKRVIATGGQTVDIDFENGIVKVDESVLDEKYISEPTTRDEYAFTYPLTVPEGYIFVMGDNRNISMDSRHPEIGLVPEDAVTGKVILRVYPFKQFGGID